MTGPTTQRDSLRSPKDATILISGDFVRTQITAFLGSSLLALTPLPADASSHGSPPPGSASVGVVRTPHQGVLPAVAADARPVLTGKLPAKTVVVRAFSRQHGGLRIGAPVPTLPLPVKVSRNGEAFTVLANPSGIPKRYFDGDDNVDLQVVVETSSGDFWVDHASAKAAFAPAIRHRESPTEQPTMGWTDPLAPTEAPDSARLRGPSQRFERLLVDSGNPAPRYELRGVEVGRLAHVGPLTNQRRPDRSTACTPTVLNRRWVRARIGSSFPVGRSRSWLRVLESDGGSYQAALKVPHHPLEKMEMMHADGQWRAVSARRSSPRHYTVAVKYLTVDNKFRATDGTCQYYLTYEPDQESGVVRESAARRRPRARTCFRADSGYTFARRRSSGNPYTVALGVSAAGWLGVNLAVQKNYAPEHHEIVYKIAGRSKLLCGNDGAPAVASIVSEKKIA